MTPESVTFHKCQPERACLDKKNFSALIKNQINTEAYIKQLETILNSLTEPVKAPE